jgi:hypothetical protein
MDNRQRQVTATRAAALAAAVAFGCASGPAFAGGAGQQQTVKSAALPGVAAGAPVAVETVVFADRGLAPVRLLRGSPMSPPADMPLPKITPRARPPAPRAVRAPPQLRQPSAPPVSTQLVSFGDGTATRVTVIRGGGGLTGALARRIEGVGQARVETVSFSDPGLPAVTVMHGSSARDWFAFNLFGPANGGELDRIAFAVDGVESRHGADLRMWRPEPNGPQGPMQVSLAAALDVGGGDRFDMLQNRLLGRAYLAQMFQRYGNWPDAVAAYNWGPGAMDQWIAGGRRPDQLPFGVARYVDLVLRNALIAAAGR